jgi:hypothetical protein
MTNSDAFSDDRVGKVYLRKTLGDATSFVDLDGNVKPLGQDIVIPSLNATAAGFKDTQSLTLVLERPK